MLRINVFSTVRVLKATFVAAMVLSFAIGGYSLLATPPAEAQADTIVRIDPPSVSTWPDAVFQVAVAVDDVGSLGAFQFTLVYDEDLLAFDSVAIGEFLGSTGREVVALEAVTGTGEVTFGAFSMPGAPGPSGSGELATVAFRAGIPGETFLRIEDVALADIANNPIDVAELNGAIVTVYAGPTPEPVFPLFLPRLSK